MYKSKMAETLHRLIHHFRVTEFLGASVARPMLVFQAEKPIYYLQMQGVTEPVGPPGELLPAIVRRPG